MKMKDRDKALLLVVLSIAIVVAVYFLVFNKFNEKRETLDSENVTLQTEVDRLKGMEANKEEVEADTTAKTEDINEILVKFEPEVRVEDIIKEFNDLYTDEIKAVKIDSEGFNMNSVFYGASTEEGATEAVPEDAAATDEAAAEEPVAEEPVAEEPAVELIPGEITTEQLLAANASITGYQSTVNLSFTSSYVGIKKVIDYINENDNRMKIESCSVTPGDTGNRYNVTMQVVVYTLTNNGKTYEAPVINGVKDGTPNIFK